MPKNTSQQLNISADEVLSPRELDVALLAKSSAGRNAISLLLGISPNSVKTLRRRIENKLGRDWQRNDTIHWPSLKDGSYGETAAALDTDGCENGDEHRLFRALRQQQNSRGISMRLLISQSKPGRDILHVSPSQRFWLRPVLRELENEKYLKLMAVDWQDTFAPPWLPLVCRGRKEIRAADYATWYAQLVSAAIGNFLEHNLPEFIGELDRRLDTFRSKTGQDRQQLPDRRQLALQVLEDFDLENYS